MELRYQYIIVGTGIAGVSAADAIRRHDPESSILLVGEEEYLPYHRPLLLGSLGGGRATMKDLFIRPASSYAENGIDIRLNTRMTTLDAASHELADRMGNRYRYDRLLLATGAAPRTIRIPGRGADEVYYFRSMRNYRMIRERFDSIRRVIIIGGGLLGTGIASTMTLSGKTVSMVFPGPYPLHRMLPADLAEQVTGLFKARGIALYEEDAVADIQRAGMNYTVATRDGGMIPGEMVIAAVGIEPMVTLAREAGLSVEQGILIDDHCRTGDPDIFAAGENSSFYSIHLRRFNSTAHYETARVHGACAGANMTGRKTSCSPIPHVHIALFDLRFDALGETDGRLKIFIDWKEKWSKGTVYYLREEKVCGLLLINMEEQLEKAVRLLALDEIEMLKSSPGI